MPAAKSRQTNTSSTWRQLNFFDSYPIEPFQIDSTSPQKQNRQKGSPPSTSSVVVDALLEFFKDPSSSILDISSGFGSILVGQSNGQISLLDRSFKSIRTWSAFNGGRCNFVRSTSIKGILVSIGEESGSSFGVLKIWNLRFEDQATNSPQLLGYSKIQNGHRPYPVTSLALTPSLSYLAIGLADGTVILYRHLDQALITAASLGSQPNRPPPILPKPKIIFNSLEPVTGLGFRTPRQSPPSASKSLSSSDPLNEPVKLTSTASRQTYLYIVTTAKVLCYLASNKSTSDPIVMDDIGGSIGCSKVMENGELILGDQDALYIYTPEGRGACLAYQSKKIKLEGWSNYLFMICQTSSQDSTELVIFDLKHRFIAYSNTFIGGISQVWSEWGEFFILTGSGKITKLVEKSFSNKLSILYEKDLYVLAINLAKSIYLNDSNNNTNDVGGLKSKEKMIDSKDLSKIYQNYGDYLYEKNDFEGSVNQFVQTIGTLQPSFVIRKFLDAQRISNLTFYLQELHSRGVANSDHTTLLLNCYTKLKDHDRLDDFIKTNNERISKDNNQLPFDLETAIRVCRQAGYFEHALYLAKQYQQHQDYLRIQIEDRSEWLDALNYMRSLGRDGAEFNLLRYGKPLLANLPEETTDLMIDVCCEKRWEPSAEFQSKNLTDLNNLTSSPKKVLNSPINQTTREVESLPQLRQFFAFFIDEPRCFIRFLETVAEKRWNEKMTEEMIEDEEDSNYDKKDGLPESWVKLSSENFRRKSSNSGSLEEEGSREDVEDREAVWGTLLELYLQSDLEAKVVENGSKDQVPETTLTTTKTSRKALSLLKWGGKDSKKKMMRYEPTQALIVCLMHDFVPGIIFLYESLGMIEDIVRFWIDRNDKTSKKNILKTLDRYGDDHPELYPIVLRFLASRNSIDDYNDNENQDGLGDLERVLEEIENRKILSTTEVIETLSKDGSLTCIGTIKNYLIKQVVDQQDQIQSDRKLIESYRNQSKKKEQEIESMKNSFKVFHLSKCSSCLGSLDLPAIHFMCQHSFHQRCLGDQDWCPKCGKSSNSRLSKDLSTTKIDSNETQSGNDRFDRNGGLGSGRERGTKRF